MEVLLTGASGTVGTAIIDHLADDSEYSFTNLDLEEVDDPNVETIEADARHYDEIRPHFDGMDTVVHLSYVSDDRPDRHDETVLWSHEHTTNLQQCATVFRAAIDAGVDAIVYASSNHAVGMYEDRHEPEIYDPDFDLTVDHTVPPQPDSMYGAMKVYAEALGRMAAEYHDTRFYAWRIGSVNDPETDTPTEYAEHLIEEGTEADSTEFREQMAHYEALWLSRRDTAHMLECFLRDESVDFDIFYGVSDNDRRWFDIDHARDVVGYDPQDNGAEWEYP